MHDRSISVHTSVSGVRPSHFLPIEYVYIHIYKRLCTLKGINTFRGLLLTDVMCS